MKLLFDENLSPKLPQRLVDIFPNSLHVRDVGMKATIDPIVWDYAKMKLYLSNLKLSCYNQINLAIIYIFDT
jgi:predicted nuclease of predicted toxin-antitoxin system